MSLSRKKFRRVIVNSSSSDSSEDEVQLDVDDISLSERNAKIKTLLL